MPAGDRTGPNGFGPMTGRGAGFCAGNSVPGYANPVRGGGYGGFGRGRGGGGRGWRHNFYATGMPYWARGYQPYPAYPVMPGYGYPGVQPEFTADDEMKMLKDQAEYMQKEITAIHNRIQELGGLGSGGKE